MTRGREEGRGRIRGGILGDPMRCRTAIECIERA